MVSVDVIAAVAAAVGVGVGVVTAAAAVLVNAVVAVVFVVANATAMAVVDVVIPAAWDVAASCMDGELLQKDDSFHWRDVHSHVESPKNFCDIGHEEFQSVPAGCTCV